MASSTTNLDLITVGQSQKETTANDLFDAESTASLFGRRASTTSALTWGYYGGHILVDGLPTSIANGTIALTANTTNFIEVDRTGVVSKNTSAWTPGLTPLYQIATGASSVTSYIDRRVLPFFYAGRLNYAMPNGNYTLLHEQARCRILEFTGTLTAQRNIVVPLGAQEWIVFNNTTGGFGLQFIAATGTGVVVAAGKRAHIYADGTNVQRITADT